MTKGRMVYMRVGRVRLVTGRWVKTEEEQKKDVSAKGDACVVRLIFQADSLIPYL